MLYDGQGRLQSYLKIHIVHTLMMNIPCAFENSRLYIYRVSVTMVFDLNTFERLNIDTCSLI